MNNHNPQLDSATSHPPSRISEGRQGSRRLDTWHMCLLVFAVLVLHWIGTQCIVNWLGGEGALVRGQDVSPANSHSDDGWRRTARGWEYKMNETAPRPSVITSAPSKHISPYQFWPAAAAACMLLLISGLPDTKNGKGT